MIQLSVLTDSAEKWKQRPPQKNSNSPIDFHYLPKYTALSSHSTARVLDKTNTFDPTTYHFLSSAHLPVLLFYAVAYLILNPIPNLN